MATWDDGEDVYGCWVSSLGAVASNIFLVTPSSNQDFPVVAFGKDRFLVTYTYFSAQYDIYGRFGIPNPTMFIPMVRR